MQSMYNSAPQPIPGHMHPHSRSYPVDLGMSHHTMMDQVTQLRLPKCHLRWSLTTKSMQLPSCAVATMDRMSLSRPAFHASICNSQGGNAA